MKRSKYDPKLDPKNFPKPSEPVPAPKTPAPHPQSHTRATDIADHHEERQRAKAAHMGNSVSASDEITLRDHQRADRERQAAKSHYQGAPALHLVNSPHSGSALKSEGGRVVPMARAADVRPASPLKPKA